MNNPFALPANGKSADWLVFLVMVIAIGIAVAIVVVWATVYRPKNKKKRHKHRRRHHRQHNPTLAQTGGLPPMRDPDEPPPGP